jgi:hypothetical protein
MYGFQSLSMPQKAMYSKLGINADNKIVATSAAASKYDLNYYLKGALAGGICCSITHGALW